MTVQRIIREIMETIDKESSPEKMTKAEALDFLEGISDEIESRTAALRDEIEREEKD